MASAHGDAMGEPTPFSVLTEIEVFDRADAELLRLEIERLAKRYGTGVRSVHLERSPD